MIFRPPGRLALTGLAALTTAVVCACSPPAAGAAPEPTTARGTATPNPSTTATPTGSRPQVADIEAEVRAAFDRYVDAAVAGDGEGVVAAVTTGTIERYEQWRTAALDMPREELSALPFSDQLAVTSLRGGIPAERLRTADGAQLLADGVRAGQLDVDTLATARVSGISARGSDASALVTLADEQGSVRLDFARESGIWRLDLLSVLDKAAAGLEAVAREQGASRAAFLEQLIILDHGEAGVDRAWRPVGRG